MNLRREMIAELLGTFILVFAGTGAIVINSISGGAITHVGVALTFGLVVMAMIYALGEVSGAHLNPAVTIGLVIARRSPSQILLPYLVCQFVGGLLASVSLRVLFPEHTNLGATLPAGTWQQSYVLEVILTAILMFVILNVAEKGRSVGILAGVAIGGVVGLEAMFAGPICGASMNPARSLAPALVSGQTQHLWVYLMAPVLGALIGVLCYWSMGPASPENS